MPTTTTGSASSNSSPARVLGAVGMVVLGILLCSSGLQTWLSSRSLSLNFVSPALWQYLVQLPPGTAHVAQNGEIPFGVFILALGAVSLVTWLSGAMWLARRTHAGFVASLARWGSFGWCWWCLIDLWEWAWIGAGAAGWTSLSDLLVASPQFWLAGCLAGWLTTFFSLSAIPATNSFSLDVSTKCDGSKAETDGHRQSSGHQHSENRTYRWLWLASGLYVLILTMMNWRLYFNLLMPHGDSVMYEEHLWNVLHGKGFRSYLDQGLFFGEHIQFIHLFLLPLYVFWPSHLLLELCESTALALGVFPVFWMTRRGLEPNVENEIYRPTSVSWAQANALALAASVAYLFYAPMQFLDIEIDLKTFRPEAFGIPLLLLTLDQLERRHLVGILIGLTLTLTVKEDYAIVFGPLGLWIAWREFGVRSRNSDKKASKLRRARIAAGIALSLFSVAYLWVATRVVMPWFRSGNEVHYARYFARFGETPEQIVRTMVTQPGLLIGELCTMDTMLYALMMLAPLAFIPLLSPARLAVGLPLFGVLCLNELAKDPRHQFHAPLVAIVFWSLAGGVPRAITLAMWLPARIGLFLARPESPSATGEGLRSPVPSKHWRPKAVASGTRRELRGESEPGLLLNSAGNSNSSTACVTCQNLLWTSSVCTGLFLSLSPFGLSFWDPGSNWNWNVLYGSNRRGELFARIIKVIPQDSRVASTDFVHPRFTHFARSYDYSGYRRKVAGDKLGVPDDTDFIVIDTNHRYSLIKSAAEIPEYRDHPDDWELLPDVTDGFFIVLRRRW